MRHCAPEKSKTPIREESDTNEIAETSRQFGGMKTGGKEYMNARGRGKSTGQNVHRA
jgi:hypothetical protein